MNETVQNYINHIKDRWQNKTNKQKAVLLGSIISVLILIGILIYFTTKTTMVPLYSNLTPSETGLIKENLDSKGIQNAIFK